MMFESDQDASGASAPGVLLVVVSSAALHETAALGGSVFLHALVEQLLGHLGTCSIDTETNSTIQSASDDVITSWRCQLENKYYTAKLKAILVQQQEAAQKIEKEQLLLFSEAPEAVVFICSQREQQRLHDMRRTLTKSSSHDNGETEGHIEPLPFMKEIYYDCRKQQQGEEDELDRRGETDESADSRWWVRDVPLKFILSLHCNQHTSQQNRSSSNSSSNSNCSSSNSSSSSSSSSHDDEVETVVWNIGCDVFFEGMELCFTSSPAPQTGAASECVKSSVMSVIEQQNYRLKKVAEGLQCHMWPGLCRRGGGRGKSSNDKNESNCNTNKSTSQCVSSVNANEAAEEGEHRDNRDSQKKKDIDCEEKALKKKEEPLGSAEDVEAFDALAAAMIDLKQKGFSVNSAERRRTAMRLAAQLASLTMCDEN